MNKSSTTPLEDTNLKELSYNIWVTQNYPTHKEAYLQCAEATEKMVKRFPELVRVRGLASVEEPHGFPPTKTPHWWCVTPQGEIVDPTSHQYPTQILDYSEVDEALGSPSGKCPNCGNLCYDGAYLCSPKCDKEYLDYLNSPESY